MAVAVVRPDGRVLLGRRKGAHGPGKWSFPGGWIDRGDVTIENACRREVLEETGIIAGRIEPILETKSEYEDFSSITLFYQTRIVTQTVERVFNREPDKCHGWEWFTLDEASRLDLFGGVLEAIGAIRAWGRE